MPGDIFIPGDLAIPGDIATGCDDGAPEPECMLPWVAEQAVNTTSRLAA
jgi:hypothetical protein